jgi:hypothetical protein
MDNISFFVKKLDDIEGLVIFSTDSTLVKNTPISSLLGDIRRLSSRYSKLNTRGIIMETSVLLARLEGIESLHQRSATFSTRLTKKALSERITRALKILLSRRYDGYITSSIEEQII